MEIIASTYTILALITTLISSVGALIVTIKKQFKRLERVEYITQLNLGSELTRLHYKAQERGYKYIYEFERYKLVYHEYKELKGNGYVDKMTSEYMALPIK